MTDEELARIKDRDASHAHAYEMDYDIPDALHDYITDVPALVEEVERLRLENAALREIARAVAGMEHCQWCPPGTTIWEPHAPSCYVAKARALT